MKVYYYVKDAVTDALCGLPFGVHFTTQDFYRLVIANLRMNGSNAQPMQESVSRIFRMYKQDFGVVLVKHGQATWVKRREH